MTRQRTIVVVGGYWSTNIGNSFFQLGAEYLLRTVFPNEHVVMLSDQPGYLNVQRGNSPNSLILLEHMAIDYLVILGPFLRKEYDKIWLNTLQALYSKDVRIIMISAGMMDYSYDAIQQYRKWLSETPPCIFITRDEDTYDSLGDIPENSYSGIDVAFFVSDLFRSVTLNIDRFVVFNFDKTPEPRFSIGEGQSEKSQADYCFEFLGEVWNIEVPKRRTNLAHKFKFYPFLDCFWPQSYPEKVGDLKILRTDHRFNPLILRKVYKGQNSFVSDIPYTYLTLYANAACAFSNRVHACVAALAYGNSAMLFSRTPRARLLKRVGLEQITKKPQRLDSEYLAEEKSAMIDFLKSAIRQM
jgi:hypothetical protein